MHMPPDTIVYAIGDIHGCPWLLDIVFDWIGAHAETHNLKHKHIIVLGDMIDRGPQSKNVIDRLIVGPPTDFSLTCLRGNHEDMMLRTISTGSGLAVWLQNGGRQTLESYGIDQINTLQRSSPAAISQLLTQSIPKAHQIFLLHTTLYLQLGGYLFVHAGVRPGVNMSQQSQEDLLWIRKDFTQSTDDLGSIVVHGHTRSPDPTERCNAIGLDTGAVNTGKLSCVALWLDKREFFSTPGTGLEALK